MSSMPTSIVPDTNFRIHPHTFVAAGRLAIVVVCVDEAALGRLDMRRRQIVRQPAEVQPVVKRRRIHDHHAVPAAADRHGRSAVHSSARCWGAEKGPVDRERLVPVAVAQRKCVVEQGRDGRVQRTGSCVVATTRVQQGQHIGCGKGNVLDEYNLVHRVAQARQIRDSPPVALATGVRHPPVGILGRHLVGYVDYNQKAHGNNQRQPEPACASVHDETESGEHLTHAK
ncbi:hypothetical protein SPBR_01834 [Sporothrix brasiliensis 5110]|uniref:Uncharacterized protein n=1 Tax=Sporothrix brasiliensis 5110 TaxID=1398154 RepID=A0A0C2EX49_9PEZI|nr:uncharacterized protein SPBR_01834 [Sporothrix brasiliensis 5110]KIH91139.1 hypothetical protein SPBR_01834 [Sporothrix brasiliensis 5110]